jgi:hypothetical protein
MYLLMFFKCLFGVGDSGCEVDATRFLGEESSTTRHSERAFSGLGVILRTRSWPGWLARCCQHSGRTCRVGFLWLALPLSFAFVGLRGDSLRHRTSL